MIHQDLYTQLSTIDGAGLGLFTSTERVHGEEIVGLEQPYQVNSVQSVEDQGLPYDSVIHIIKHNPIIIGDRAFVGNRKPMWYYMNHSRKPNTFMRKKGDTIIWKALGMIPTGTELMYEYQKELIDFNSR